MSAALMAELSVVKMAAKMASSMAASMAMTRAAWKVLLLADSMVA